jgi:hypothetical protein
MFRLAPPVLVDVLRSRIGPAWDNRCQPVPAARRSALSAAPEPHGTACRGGLCLPHGLTGFQDRCVYPATVATGETGLSELGLRVRSLRILIPLYSDDSREALSMAVEACELGGSIVNRSSPAYTLAVTLKALILARLGFADEYRVTLNESGESFSRLDPADKIDSVFGFSERRWRFYRTRTFAELGTFDEAWEAQDHALELYSTDVVGDPTIIRLDRALCLVRKNEIDAGCKLAADTLSSLPPEHHASILLRCGKKILTAVSRNIPTVDP